MIAVPSQRAIFNSDDPECSVRFPYAEGLNNGALFLISRPASRGLHLLRTV